jgi:hypothetical protein
VEPEAVTKRKLKSKKGPPCIVCRHADRALIEATRIAGASLDNIARKFNISRDCVHRHMTNHVSEADRLQHISDIPVQELAERAANEGVSLLDYFAIVRGILLQQFQLCASVNDKNGVAILAGRLTEVLRAIGTASGEIMKSPLVQNVNNTINFINSPVFVDLQQMLIRRLQGHPEALASVCEGLADLERRSAPRPLAGPVIEHQGFDHVA